MKHLFSILLFLVVVGCTQKPKAVTVEPDISDIDYHYERLLKYFDSSSKYYRIYNETDSKCAKSNWEYYDSLFKIEDGFLPKHRWIKPKIDTTCYTPKP